MVSFLFLTTKKLLEQGLEQHYFDENKLYKLPIEDQLYRHYDEVLIPIREFKNLLLLMIIESY